MKKETTELTRTRQVLSGLGLLAVLLVGLDLVLGGSLLFLLPLTAQVCLPILLVLSVHHLWSVRPREAALPQMSLA